LDFVLVAIILGIVEGLTEFLPISSTGHLVLVGELLQFEGPKAATFEVFIQLGAILAVLVLYRERFQNLLRFNSSEPFSGLNGIKKIAVASLPVLVVGFLARDFIKAHFFSSQSVAYALIVGGIIMCIVERLNRSSTVNSLEQLSIRTCFIIGLFQCCSLWSGISRSGSTMVGSLLFGVQRKTAAEFSFLIAVPVMCAATTYDLLKSLTFLSMQDIPLFALGFVTAFLSAFIAIRAFIGLLQHWTLVPFGIYRVGLGLLVLFLH
jgi:undecaprenyl-diphosphatase